MPTKSTRGGVRKGAGRPSPHGQPTIRKTIQLTPNEWAMLAKLHPTPSQAIRIQLQAKPIQGA